jgi:hypothetical protein
MAEVGTPVAAIVACPVLPTSAYYSVRAPRMAFVRPEERTAMAYASTIIHEPQAHVAAPHAKSVYERPASTIFNGTDKAVEEPAPTF